MDLEWNSDKMKCNGGDNVATMCLLEEVTEVHYQTNNMGTKFPTNLSLIYTNLSLIYHDFGQAPVATSIDITELISVPNCVSMCT